MSFIAWPVIILLILVNALYVAAEFAVVGVRRGQVREKARAGNRLAQRLLPILEDSAQLDRYIAACQIGITFSSLVLGAFGQATLTLQLGSLFGTLGWETTTALSVAATSVLVLLTVLQVVFGELVPKSLALQFPTRIALLTYIPMRWSLGLFRGFIAILNGSGLLLVKAMGIPQGAHRHIHSPEEIDMLLVESADGGLLEPDEQRRLHDALRLSGRVAREIMTPRPRTRMLDAGAGFSALVEAAMTGPHTRLPVYRDNPENVVGFVHTRDLAAHVAAKKAPQIAAVLRPIHAVPEETPIHRLLPQLRQRGQRIALVVDEFGSITGLVTLQDVLDELLGTPPDARDLQGQSPPETLPDGRIRLPGLLSLTDASRLLGVEWRDRHVTTVGGLVLKTVTHLPKAGTTLSIDGIHLEVERLDRQMIASVIATRPEQKEREET